MLATVAGSVALHASAVSAERPKIEVRSIILHSRHLGAHGLGYNDESLVELSLKLIPADIPNMISLLADSEVRVGAQFALASQCDAAIQPVREAAIEDERIAALDADDIMELIAGFSQCRPDARSRARIARVEIDAANRQRLDQRKKELDEKAANDARIQANAIRLNDPAQKKTLTRAEREEAFRRSVKAAGLENPQTPEQKALVDRMYRTMVLDEPSPQKNQ